MAEVTFVINPTGWTAAFKSWNGTPLGAWMRRQLIETQNVARLRAPRPASMPRNKTGINYSTGRLASEIVTTEHHAAGGDLEGHVVALPSYAIFVHQGTRPHVITPKTAGSKLKWWDHKPPFGYRYAKMVMHPGTLPQPFLREALDAVV